MGLRPAKTIREVKGQAWTRWSKRNMSKSYIKAMPHKDLHHLVMGNMQDDYNVVIHLVAQQTYQHRDNAIEAARKAANGYMEKNMAGKYFFQIRVFPHRIIRENKMVAGAGADRIQKGMRRAFGKPTDRAAVVREGQAIFTVYTYNTNVDIVEEAFRRASKKLSGTFKVIVEPVGRANAG